MKINAINIKKIEGIRKLLLFIIVRYKNEEATE